MTKKKEHLHLYLCPQLCSELRMQAATERKRISQVVLEHLERSLRRQEDSTSKKSPA